MILYLRQRPSKPLGLWELVQITRSEKAWYHYCLAILILPPAIDKGMIRQ